MVDETESIGKNNIPKLRAAITNLVQRFDISGVGTHVSVQTFRAEESKVHNMFNNPGYHSLPAIRNVLASNIQGNKLRSPTRLDIAVGTAKEQMFTKQNGLRAGVRKVMVLYTDGKTHPEDTKDFSGDILALKVRPLP